MSSVPPAKFFVNRGIVTSRTDIYNLLRPLLKQTVGYRYLRGRDLVSYGTGWVERIVVEVWDNLGRFAGEMPHIARIDSKTGEVKQFEIPVNSSGPRRGMMDTQDRIWFGQYRGNRIGMFDTKTTQFKEWLVPTPWAGPYDVAIDKNEEAWTGSMLNDRVVRLNTKSGEFVEYLLPRQTNVRRVYVDDRTTPVSFWVGSNHGASIIKLEPLP